VEKKADASEIPKHQPLSYYWQSQKNTLQKSDSRWEVFEQVIIKLPKKLLQNKMSTALTSHRLVAKELQLLKENHFLS